MGFGSRNWMDRAGRPDRNVGRAGRVRTARGMPEQLPSNAVGKLDIDDLAHTVPPVGTPPHADLATEERVDRQRDDDGQWCIVI
jgi:hypothetical protein